MSFIEDAISPEYAQFMRICAAEHSHQTKNLEDLNPENELIRSFEHSKINPQQQYGVINKLSDIPYLHELLNYILLNLMDKKEACDLHVEIIKERDDGLKLGYISTCSVGPSIYDVNGWDDYYSTVQIDDEFHYPELFPRLVIVDDKLLDQTEFIPEYSNNGYEFNFYKKHENDSSPSYHYWNE